MEHWILRRAEDAATSASSSSAATSDPAAAAAAFAAMDHGDVTVRTRAILLWMSISAIFVCLTRCYVRKFVIKSWGMDDVGVLVSLTCVVSFTAMGIYLTYDGGVGRHMWDITMQEQMIFYKTYYGALCTYLVVAMSVKVSLVIFFMRVFPSSALVQKGGLGLIIFIALFTISGTAAMMFHCSPVKAGWDMTLVPTAKCFSNDTMFALTMYQGVVMFITDLAIFGLPMKTLWELQMPVKKRIYVMFLCSLGCISCIASLVRFTTLTYNKTNADTTYMIADSLVWMEVEWCLALVSGSLPSLRMLPGVRTFMGSTTDKSQGYSNSRSAPRRTANDPYDTGTQLGRLNKNSHHVEIESGSLNESQERIIAVHNEVRVDVEAASQKGSNAV